MFALLMLLAACGRSSQNSETTADSLAAGVSGPVAINEEKLTAASITFLDDFTVFETEAALADAFGAESITKGEAGVFYLFKGTDREVTFHVKQDSLSMIEAHAPANWQHRNGLKLGMTIAEVVALNEGSFAFAREGGYSGPAGGRLESNFLGFGFDVPAEVKSKFQNTDWITFDELGTQSNLVTLNNILIYYDDQSIETE